MKQNNIQPNSFQLQAQQTAKQALQTARQQQAGNSPLMHAQGGGIANSSNVQSQQFGQMASFFTLNPNNVQIGQPSDQAKLASALDLIKRILKGDATAPVEKLRELGALYEYIKKQMRGDEDDEHELTEEKFEGIYDILDWFERSRAYYGYRNGRGPI